MPERAGNAEPGCLFAGCFPCDGPDAWIAIVAQDGAAWSALCDLAGRPDLGCERDPWQSATTEHERAGLARALAAWTGARSPHECLAELQRRGIASGAVQDVRDLLLDPHLEARGFYQLVEHAPEQGSGRRAWPGVPAHLSATPGAVLRRAPMLGEHNGEIAVGLLGYTEVEYDRRVASGEMGTVPANAGTRPPAERTAERLALGPWSGRRIKEHDARLEERMKERFGAGFGRPAPATAKGTETA